MNIKIKLRILKKKFQINNSQKISIKMIMFCNKNKFFVSTDKPALNS